MSDQVVTYISAAAIGIAVGSLIFNAVHYKKVKSRATDPAPATPAKPAGITDYDLKRLRYDERDAVAATLSDAYHNGKSEGYGVPLGCAEPDYNGQYQSWHPGRINRYDSLHPHVFRSRLAGFRAGQSLLREQMDARLAELKETKP